MLAELARFAADSFKPQLPGIVSMLGGYMSHADSSVALAAAVCMGAFVEGLEDSAKERDSLTPLLDPLLAVRRRACTCAHAHALFGA